MADPFLTLPLKSKPDLLRARQVTRQAAVLLGFDNFDQICLAAAVFDLACQARAGSGRADLWFAIHGDCLQIGCTPAGKAKRQADLEKLPALQISKSLPANATVPRDDVPWMLRQLAELAPVELFDEMQRMNRELLETLLELARQRGVTLVQAEPNAA